MKPFGQTLRRRLQQLQRKLAEPRGVTSAALKGAPSCSKSLDANLFGKSEEPQTPAPAVVRK
jgi:hypothetical protein